MLLRVLYVYSFRRFGVWMDGCITRTVFCVVSMYLCTRCLCSFPSAMPITPKENPSDPSVHPSITTHHATNAPRNSTPFSFLFPFPPFPPLPPIPPFPPTPPPSFSSPTNARHCTNTRSQAPIPTKTRPLKLNRRVRAQLST